MQSSPASSSHHTHPDARLEQLHSDYSRRVAELEAQLQYANAQVATAHANAVPRHTPKPTKPREFTGHPKANVDAWLFEMEVYMSVTGVVGDPLRVNFAVAFLREMATTWWRSVVHEHRARDAEPPSTWDAFRLRSWLVSVHSRRLVRLVLLCSPCVSVDRLPTTTTHSCATCN